MAFSKLALIRLTFNGIKMTNIEQKYYLLLFIITTYCLFGATTLSMMTYNITTNQIQQSTYKGTRYRVLVC
jgi:hypothetical protein